METNISKKADLDEVAEEYEKNHTHQRYDGGGFTPEYNATLAEAFQAGAQWQKEQMLKDAVEATIENGMYLSSIDCAKMGYKLGDKVKIIIVKEEEQK